MANYHEDIINIELESGTIHRSFLHHAIGAGDKRANRFGVKLFRNGVPENVNGSCFGLFIRADGQTVTIENGTVSGNVAYVTLPEACYVVEGQFCLTIKATTENDTTTLRIIDGVVDRTSTSVLVDPGTVIPSIEDLIAAINAAVESIPPDYSALSDHVDEIDDRVDATFAGGYADCIEVGTGTNFNNITTPGSYVVMTNTIAASCSNIPVQENGRLYVFSSVGTTPFIQIYITAHAQMFIRRISTYDATTNTPWFDQSGIETVDLTTYTDANNFPLNSVAHVPFSSIGSITHFPAAYNRGATVFTLPDQQSGAVQFAVCYVEGLTANRIYYNGAWGDWKYNGVRTETFRCLTTSTGEHNTFTNLAWGLRYMMQHFNEWNEYYRCEILIDPGTFSLIDVVDYIANDTLDIRGLYLPPYCTLKGAGKDRTTVTFNYTGTDEEFMFYVSGLNLAYECRIEDLTLTVKNLRYTIHSDNVMSSMPDVTPDNDRLKNNNSIVLKNVRLIHQGFDSGKHGTDPATGNAYSVPACWGGGSFNNSNRYFYDCEMIANQNTAWLNHNRTGLTKPSEFVFERCIFINGNDTTFSLGTSYDSICFISWGSGIRNPVRMVDCFVNRFVAVSVRTDMGNTNAVCDYDILINNDLPVFEYSNNDSQLNDNYITGNCKPECAGTSVVGYKPVSKSDIFGLAHTYNNADPVVGIAINSASAGKKVNVQYSGLVYLDLLKSGGFTAGSNIGYNGSAWVEDNTHPIVKALTQHVGRIIES